MEVIPPQPPGYSDYLPDEVEARDLAALEGAGVELGGVTGQCVQAVLMGGGYESGYWMHDYLYS